MTLEEKRLLLKTLQTYLQLGVWLIDIVDDAFLMQTLPAWGAATEAVERECKEQLGLLRLAEEMLAEPSARTD